MRSWTTLLRLVHDHIQAIFFVLLVAIFGVGWLVFEAFRSHQSRDEIFRLRRRLSALEREQRATRAPIAPVVPVVMPERWIRLGSAGTTSDGGCLILVENVADAEDTATLTIRVDGYAVKRDEPFRVGEQVELPGKSGTYLVELYGTEGAQALLGVTLRSKHIEDPQPLR